MKRTSLWYAAVLPLATMLAACPGGGDKSGDDADTTAVAADTPAPVVPPPPAPDTTGADSAVRRTLLGDGEGDPDIAGEAVLSRVGTGTRVVVTLHGAPAGTYRGDVRAGVCRTPGAKAATLQPVTVDAGGTGSSTSQIDMDMASLGDHIIILFTEGDSPEGVCG